MDVTCRPLSFVLYYVGLVLAEARIGPEIVPSSDEGVRGVATHVCIQFISGACRIDNSSPMQSNFALVL